MIFKKTGLSYITAVLGAICSLVTLFLWLVPVYGFELGLSGNLFDTPVEYSHLASAGTVLLAVLLFFHVRYIKKHVFASKDKKACSRGLYVALSILSCVVLFGAGISLIYIIGGDFLLNPLFPAEFGNSLFLLKNDEANLLYKLAISFVFDVFGASAPVYLVACLCFFVLFCIVSYIGLFSVFGPFRAFCGTAFLFLYAFFENSFLTKGEVLFNLFVAAFLFMVFALLLRTRHDGIMVSPLNGIIFAVLGLCLGGLGSVCPEVLFALIPITLIIVLDVIDLSEVSKEYEEPEKFAVNRSILPSVLTWIFTAVGLLVAVMVGDWIMGLSGFDSLAAYFGRFTGHDIFTYGLIQFPFAYMAALAVAAAFLVFLGFMQGVYSKTDKSTIPFFILLITCFLNIYVGFSQFSVFFFVMISGLMIAEGLVSFVSGEGLYREDREKLEVVYVDEDVEAEPETEPEAETETEPKTETSETEPEPAVSDAATPETPEPEVSAPSQEQVVVLIDNPLPLPKKHVKKEISYDFEIPEDRLCYDHEIKADDDFDI